MTAISGFRLQILCPKFLGRRNMFDENAVFLEVSVSQNLGHRIWDPFPLSAPTVRRPLPLYAGGAGGSGGGWVGSGGRVSWIGWFMRLGQLLRDGVHATRAGRGEESCGRHGRQGGSCGWVRKGVEGRTEGCRPTR